MKKSQNLAFKKKILKYSFQYSDIPKGMIFRNDVSIKALFFSSFCLLKKICTESRNFSARPCSIFERHVSLCSLTLQN